MKVKTDVKGGGLLGLNLIAIVVVDLNLLGGCKQPCYSSCSSPCK